MTMREEWRPIDGYPRYEVSDRGRVRALAGTGEVNLPCGVTYRRNYRARVLALTPHGRAKRPAVSLTRDGDKRLSIQVHRLVARAFLGTPPPGHVVCHNDGDPTNNRLSNLRYDTPKGNNDDKRRHGTLQLGERHHAAVINEAIVRRIRRSSKPTRELAEDLGVSYSVVYCARKGKTWSHVR
jgi:hypothetical protein